MRYQFIGNGENDYRNLRSDLQKKFKKQLAYLLSAVAALIWFYLETAIRAEQESVIEARIERAEQAIPLTTPGQTKYGRASITRRHQTASLSDRPSRLIFSQAISSSAVLMPVPARPA